MKKIISVCLLATLTLTACHNNDSKQDEKRILQAINAHHSEHPLCMVLPPAIDNGVTQMLGSDTVRFMKTDGTGKRINTNAVKQMSVLTKAGIYRKRRDEKNPSLGKKAWFEIYELTEKGTQFITGNTNNRQLCIGSLTANNIQWYSQPTADNGLTVSRVSYQGRYHLHKWASKLLKIGNPQLLHNLSQPSEMQAVVIKTNKGWIDKREIQERQ